MVVVERMRGDSNNLKKKTKNPLYNNNTNSMESMVFMVIFPCFLNLLLNITQ
jgi:hypothetical protein